MNENFVRVVPSSVRIDNNLQYILDSCYEEVKSRGFILTERELINHMVQDGFETAIKTLYKAYFAEEDQE